MDSIELECPGCADVLEIDTAFAGGICRCATCGELMTVPAAGSTGEPQKLSRPSRPDRPDVPGAPVDDEEEVVGDLIDEEDEATFTTTSGETVKIDRRKVPTARKKKRAMKAGILAGFIVFALALVFCCYVAINFLLSGDKTTSSEAETFTREVLGNYDPNVNPFEMTKPNFLGITLDDEVVVLVDASSESQRWLNLARFAVQKSLDSMPDGKKVQILFWTEGEGHVFPDKSMRAITAGDREKLGAFLDDIYATGQTDLSIGLSKALVYKPKHVIFVTGQLFDDDQANKVLNILEQYPNVLIEMIMIGQDTPKLQNYIESQKGQYVNLPIQRLGTWYREVN